MPLREYQTDMMQMPLVRQFITDDEVNADLTPWKRLFRW